MPAHSPGEWRPVSCCICLCIQMASVAGGKVTVGGESKSVHMKESCCVCLNLGRGAGSRVFDLLNGQHQYFVLFSWTWGWKSSNPKHWRKAKVPCTFHEKFKRPVAMKMNCLSTSPESCSLPFNRNRWPKTWCVHYAIMCCLKTSNPQAGSLISNFIKIFFFLNSLSPEPAKLQF